MAKAKKVSEVPDGTTFLLWDRTNQLVHGTYDSHETANDAKTALATQPGHEDYRLTIVEVPPAE